MLHHWVTISRKDFKAKVEKLKKKLKNGEISEKELNEDKKKFGKCLQPEKKITKE